MYERASTAKVNWGKSEALQVGRWREEAAPVLPGGLQWGQQGLKVLGVYLGSAEYQEKNWEGLLDQVCARLSRWRWLLPQLSYRGRVLVVNNLVASMLWHKLIVLPPPRGLMEEIQRLIIDFFWAGHHWIRAAALYLPVEEGGQGLMDISSRIWAFRLEVGQRILYDCEARWLSTARLILRKAGRLGYDKHLFLLNLREADITGLTPFYASVLEAWQVFQASRTPGGLPGMWIFEEPLFFNDFLRTETLSSPSLRAALREAGCVKLGHLLKATRTSAEVLGRMANIRSTRVLSRVVREVCGSLSEPLRAFAENCTNSDQWDDEYEYSFPSLTVIPAVGEWQENEDQLLSFNTTRLGEFKEMGKKAVYQTCVKVTHARSLTGVRASRWAGVFGQRSSPVGCWRSLYKRPIDKRAADLQWRIIHGAVATNRHLAHFDPNLGEGCPFCLHSETLLHLFIKCPRLEHTFNLLKLWFSGLGEGFSFERFIFGPKYSVSKKVIHTLLNFMSGMVKLAIWLTRRNKIKGAGSTDPVQVLTGMVAARLRVEHAYHKLTNNLEGFNHVWAVNGVLCLSQEDGELAICF